MADKIALVSGRFSPPHDGHMAMLKRLLKKYAKVKVIILDYPERDFPLCYCKKVFEAIFEDEERIEFLVNKTHFGEISEEGLRSYGCDVFVSGNLTVLRHIERLGFPCEYAERAFEYSARNYKRPE